MNIELIRHEMNPRKFYEYYDLVFELGDTDGFFTYVVIHDEVMRELLEKYEIIETGHKGSSMGENFDVFQKLIEDMLTERVALQTEHEKDSRYPYTYACDFIRTVSPWDDNGCILDRSDASNIIELMSLALDMNNETLAEELADTFLSYEPMIHVFKTDDRFEKVDVPDDAIGYKIVHVAGMKQAHWLQPKER